MYVLNVVLDMHYIQVDLLLFVSSQIKVLFRIVWRVKLVPIIYLLYLKYLALLVNKDTCLITLLTNIFVLLITKPCLIMV
jgi:hypothetical protein